MHKAQIINHMAARMGYRSYLEIGVDGGENVRHVNIPLKDGVDPLKRCSEVTYHMTSDDFFRRHPERKYDAILIDGHHDSEFVCRDVNNSLRALNAGGTIFMHDCFPNRRELAVKEAWREPLWCGDGFKVVHSMVSGYSDSIKCFVVDTDYGVGVLMKLKPEVPDVVYDDSYSWDEMMSDPKRQINLMSVEKFLRKYPPVGG